MYPAFSSLGTIPFPQPQVGTPHMAISSSDSNDCAKPKRVFVTYESRFGGYLDALPGLKLLLASMNEFAPGEQLYVFIPQEQPAFREWALSHAPNSILEVVDFGGIVGYNIKPMSLMRLLDRGFDEVIWLDSDLMLERPMGTLFDRPPETIMVVEENGPWNDGVTTYWPDLRLARPLAHAVNSSIIRVTRQHRAVLMAWNERMQRREYSEAQAQPREKRPMALLTDQEVLAGILASDLAASWPVDFVRSGRDLIHCLNIDGLGYRWRCLYRRPVFLHAHGIKAWWPMALRQSPYWSRVFFDTSPHTRRAAHRYGHLLAHDEQAWLRFGHRLSFALHVAFLGNPFRANYAFLIIRRLARMVERMRGRRGNG